MASPPWSLPRAIGICTHQRPEFGLSSVITTRPPCWSHFFMSPDSKLSAKNTSGSFAMPASPGCFAARPPASPRRSPSAQGLERATDFARFVKSGRLSSAGSRVLSRASRSCDWRSIHVAGYSWRRRSNAEIASSVLPLPIRPSACLNSSSPTVSARAMMRPVSCCVRSMGTLTSTGGFVSVRMRNASGFRSRNSRARMSRCQFSASPPSRWPRGSMSAMARPSGPSAWATTLPWGEMIMAPLPRCATTSQMKFSAARTRNACTLMSSSPMAAPPIVGKKIMSAPANARQRAVSGTTRS